VVEAAWAYRHRPSIGAQHAARQKEASTAVKEMAWKAQHRLHARYSKLLAKTKQKVMTAIGRELLRFIWAIGVEVERTVHGAKLARRAA
jgi:transposase